VLQTPHAVWKENSQLKIHAINYMLTWYCHPPAAIKSFREEDHHLQKPPDREDSIKA
jgi:hypothetical protein